MAYADMTEAERFAAIDAAHEHFRKEGHPWDVKTEDGLYEYSRAVLIKAGIMSPDCPRLNITRIIDDPDSPDIIIEAEVMS